MAKSKTKTDTINDPFAMSQALIQQVQEAGLGSMHLLGTEWFEKMADINSELVSFIADRISKDVETQHTLLHCTSTEEFQKAQLAFIEEAHAQYTVETGKLVQMGLDMLPLMTKGSKGTPV